MPVWFPPRSMGTRSGTSWLIAFKRRSREVICSRRGGCKLVYGDHFMWRNRGLSSVAGRPVSRLHASGFTPSQAGIRSFSRRISCRFRPTRSNRPPRIRRSGASRPSCRRTASKTTASLRRCNRPGRTTAAIFTAQDFAGSPASSCNLLSASGADRGGASRPCRSGKRAGFRGGRSEPIRRQIL